MAATLQKFHNITLRQSHLEAFLRDPVLAAWVILNMELDVFQQFKLRTMWFVPEVYDDSGISTGKSEVVWAWCQLRAILLPQPVPYPSRTVLVYYPTGDAAQNTFQPKYDKYLETGSKFFKQELRPMHGGRLGYQALKGAVQWVYRCGSIVQCPDPGFARDAESQASRRCHDIVVDEAKVIELRSKGLDAQILGRGTAPGWNNAHPVWGNHKILMGHAEDPDSHPAAKRYKAAKKQIGDGSQRVALISSCYVDWSTPEFKKKYRPDGDIRTAKLTMAKSVFGQTWHGLWARGTQEWYDSAHFTRVMTRSAPVLVKRDNARSIFAAGWDTAPGPTRMSDFNAGAVWRAAPVDGNPRVLRGMIRIMGRLWKIGPVYSVRVPGRSAGILSGVIHGIHQNFSLCRLVFDPHGGGSWVQKELWKASQVIDGKEQTVTGLCSVEHAGIYPEALPILVPFTHGSTDLANVWQEDRYKSSAEGPVEAMHRIMRDYVESGAIEWPASEDDRPVSDLAALTAEQRTTLKYLTMAQREFLTIKVVLDKNGSPKITKNGFLTFTADGRKKKDMAYANLYALMGLLSFLMDPDFEDEGTVAAGGASMAMA